MVRDVKDEKRN